LEELRERIERLEKVILDRKLEGVFIECQRKFDY
jgi:hypothetical protein